MGIGTTAPDTKLHVVGDVTIPNGNLSLKKDYVGISTQSGTANSGGCLYVHSNGAGPTGSLVLSR